MPFGIEVEEALSRNHRSFVRARARWPFAALIAAGLALTSSASAQPQEVVPPRLLDHADAIYPPSHLTEGIDITIEVQVTIEKDGTVSEAVVARGTEPPKGYQADFEEAALRAVRGWRFAPATRGGAPVRVRIKIPFHFAPDAHRTEPPPPAPRLPPGTRAPPPAPKEPPHEIQEGLIAPHSVSEPGKPIEIHVQGRPNPPRRGASDFRLDAATLRAAPHATAADMLEAAPGVSVTHPEGDAVAQRIYLRGFDADHGQDIDFAVGAVPLNQPSHIHGQGYADLNLIIPETVRSIRVVEGVYDPQQGDFAVAGSIDYDLGVEERGLRFKASYGSFNTKRLLALWAPEGLPEDTFAAAVFHQTDGFGEGTRGSMSGAVTGQYRFELPGDHSALLHLGAYGARASIAGVLRRDDIARGRVGFYDAYPDPSARSQSAAAARAQIAATVEGAGDDGSSRSISLWGSLATYRSRLNFTGYVQRSRVRPEWAGRGDLIEQANNDAAFGGSMAYRTRRYEPTSWLGAQLAFGADAATHGIEQSQNLLQAPQNETWDNRVDADIRVTHVGLHADALLSVPYARLRGGLRTDLAVFDIDDRLGNFIPAFQEETHIEGFRRTAAGVAWGPRVSLEVDPLRWLRLSAAYGQGYRSPQARQLEEGESAPFATVQSYEAGLRVADGTRLSFTAAVYETRLSYDLAFDAAEGRLERIGPTTRRGLVGHVQAAPLPGFISSLSATFVEATLDDPPPPTPDNPTPAFVEGQQLPFVPPVVVRADVGYHRPIARLFGEPVEARAGYGMTFLSPRPLPYDREGAAVFLVDASLGVRRGFLELGVEAQNLLDARHADTEYSFVSSWEPGAIPSALPARHLAAGPPLTVLGTITLFL